MRVLLYFGLAFLLTACYGVNEKTTEIGNINDSCLQDSAIFLLTQQYSIEQITDSHFLEGLQEIQSFHITPTYILYFHEEPREIIGCNPYAVRCAFNPKISDHVINGLSTKLSDKEQVRIRNRVQKAIMQYQCQEQQKVSEEWLKKPAVYSDEFYDL